MQKERRTIKKEKGEKNQVKLEEEKEEKEKENEKDGAEFNGTSLSKETEP